MLKADEDTLLTANLFPILLHETSSILNSTDEDKQNNCRNGVNIYFSSSFPE